MSKVLGSIAKKALMSGLGALSFTEESLRGVPNYLVEQAKRQKEDLIIAVANEVSKFFSRIKVHEEVQKVLTNLNIHLDMTITFSSKHKKGSSKNLKLKLKS